MEDGIFRLRRGTSALPAPTTWVHCSDHTSGHLERLSSKSVQGPYHEYTITVVAGCASTTRIGSAGGEGVPAQRTPERQGSMDRAQARIGGQGDRREPCTNLGLRREAPGGKVQ